ncbi:hypothetical protein L596_027073 [Steinernema carpocapsae]|uniref:RING-type domain-containing protein n=1 Tax=Steinernema carpocapsae TaxID=34508 RepID=A0A4U5M3B8_STECR|nr:hypothetical protein L596_027073 [Steinernema carpocapsae]
MEDQSAPTAAAPRVDYFCHQCNRQFHSGGEVDACTNCQGGFIERIRRPHELPAQYVPAGLAEFIASRMNPVPSTSEGQAQQGQAAPTNAPNAAPLQDAVQPDAQRFIESILNVLGRGHQQQQQAGAAQQQNPQDPNNPEQPRGLVFRVEDPQGFATFFGGRAAPQQGQPGQQQQQPGQQQQPDGAQPAQAQGQGNAGMEIPLPDILGQILRRAGNPHIEVHIGGVRQQPMDAESADPPVAAGVPGAAPAAAAAPAGAGQHPNARLSARERYQRRQQMRAPGAGFSITLDGEGGFAPDQVVAIMEQFMGGVLPEDIERPAGVPGGRIADVDIARLPMVTVDATQCDKQCTTCMDNLKEGDEVGRLDCGHMFHRDCIVPWLQTRNTCPVCRAAINPSTWIVKQLEQNDVDLD